SFWQDVSQIKQHYQTEWATILNNCAVLQLFGVSSYMMATNFGQLVGASARDIRAVERYEQILVLEGKKPVRARRFDYLVDREFRGLYDPNPLYIGRDGRGLDRT
ncbi:MAG: TraM recognition domain-containing protein, partial [Aggregatilineales bacterium]